MLGQILIPLVLLTGGILALIAVSTRVLLGQMERELSQSGERAVIGPDACSFLGSTRRFGFAKSAGVIALTASKIILKRPFSRTAIIPRSEIFEVTEWVPPIGNPNLIIVLTDGTKVHLIVKEHNIWMNELGGIRSS